MTEVFAWRNAAAAAKRRAQQAGDIFTGSHYLPAEYRRRSWHSRAEQRLLAASGKSALIN
jgi:hypothetical protein